jgi:hypothetical protein
MTYKKTYDIQKKKQLIITLPERFKSIKRVMVIVENIDEDRESKIAVLREASADPLFLADIVETVADFEYSDNEL